MLTNIQKEREREKKMVSDMIRLYCRKQHHQKTLCPEYRALENYSQINGLIAAWISIGNIWMFGGLLAALKLCKKK